MRFEKYLREAAEYNFIYNPRIAMMQGNKKLSNKIKTFNLPAGWSCPNAKECYKNCYAKKAERIYPSSRKSRWNNYMLAKTAIPLLKNLIKMHLKKGDIVRIHESGDMFSQEYIDMWSDICKERPDVMFYTYTKTEGMFNWSEIKKNPNFNLISSMVGGMKNFGPEQEITIRAKELGAFLCPCRPKNNIRCGIDCSECMTPGHNLVMFVQH